MKRGDNNGDPRDWSENSGRRLRPRSPYVYNKAADSFVFDAAHQALEAQYEKSSVSCDSRHCLVKFIRPVSLATLKSLSHTRLNGMKVNVTSSTNSKKIQPILCSRTSHCIDGSTSNSSLANDYSRLSKVSLVGDKRDIRTTDACSRCSFDLVGNEQGFLHSAKSLNSRLLHQKHHLLSDFNSLDETATNIENVIPFQPSVLHRELHTLRKPYVTSSFKIISGSVTSVAIEKTTNNDINSVVPARTNSDLLSVKNAGYLVRHKTEQIFENKQRCLSPYETRPNSRNSIICDSLQKSQSTPTPNLTYKKIKQDFELFKREISRHLKISETVSNNVEKSVYFENKEDGGVFKVVGDGNLNCAIPIYQPYSHSVVILRNHNPRTGEEYRSEENDFDKAKEGSNVDIFGCTECSQIPIQSDNTSAPPQNCIGSGADTGFTQAIEKSGCQQHSLSCSESHVKVYSQKQVEIDSGNGTDEDDHTSKENTLLINASVGQKTTDGISYSNNSDVVEVDECYLSDDGQIEDDEESQGDSDKSSDNGHQSNEEVSASPTNSSYSETLGNNSSDIECSTDLPTINKLLEVRCDSEKYHSDETDLDANDKPEIIEVYVDEDSNTDLCISSKLSNLKLSTFSTITEKHSKLSVTSYDPSTTKKDILSAGRSIPSIEQKVISKDDRASISSQSSKLSNNHNIPTENSIKDEKTLNLMNSKLSDESSKSVADLDDSSSINFCSKEIKVKTKKILINRFAQCIKKSHPALIDSLFPHVPPVLRFVEEGQKLEPLPWEFRRSLKWRASLLTPIVVKQTLQRSGFRASKLTTAAEDLETVESSDWIFYFGKHIHPQVFRTIKMYQKVNHLPCSFQLGRKDRLWRNIVHMQVKHGRDHFNFMPQTYCLPGDLDELKKVWNEEGQNQRWIMKPPASARGIGVRLVTKWSQIPKKRPALIQRYLSRPFLINDSKFDLRIYVYISSINPLRLYIHEDGLVRFASQKYSNSVRSLGNRFIHLTNYSINRLNSEYISNTNEFAAKGHKWSLRALWMYLKSQGISPAPIWSSIKDVVVKTVISTEAAFNTALKVYCNHSLSVHEIFGFDIFLDEDLQPWLLEVNVSPSMHSDSPLDAKIKGVVIKDMLNISGLHLPETAEVHCRTIVPSCSSKYTSNTPDLTMYQSIDTSDIENNSSALNADNVAGIKVNNSQSKDGVIIRRPIRSANDLDSMKLKNAESQIQRPNPPSHRWLLDERLFIQLTSSDEKEKRKYFKTRASQYGLPGVNQYSTKRNSSIPLQYSQKYSKILISSKSSISHDSDTSSSSELSSSSSDTGDETETACSMSPPIHVRNNRRDSPLSSALPSGKSAQSKGIGPSPDFKVNNPPELKVSVNKLYNSKKGSLYSRSSAHRISPNILKGVRCKSSTCYKNLNSPSSLSSSNTPPHVILSNATNEILDCLTPSDVRILISMIDELERAGGFHCVFPPKSPGLAVRYLAFFESPRYENLLCIAYLQKYGQDKEEGIQMLRKICEKRIHFKSSVYGDEIAWEHHWQRYRKRKSNYLKEMIVKQTGIIPSKLKA